MARENMTERLRHWGRRGFTLLETAAVAGIVAILALLVTVAFDASSDDIAADGAEAAVRAVVFAEQRLYQREARFSDVPSELQGLESAFSYTDGGPVTGTGTRAVYVKVATTKRSVLIASVDQGQCVASELRAPELTTTEQSACPTAAVQALG